MSTAIGKLKARPVHNHLKMPSDIVLYRANGACSLIPHILLNELEVQSSEVLLKLQRDGYGAADGSFSNAEYKKTVPSGFVPALTVDGEVITELLAVLTYISELAPERKMFGTTQMERAQAYSWLTWLSATLHGMGFAMMWRAKRITDSDDEVIQDSIKEKGYEVVLDCYELIEKRLDGPHVVGGTLTVVDLALYNFCRWG